METKEQLVGNIKEWIKIDNEITKLKNEIKERTNRKKKLTEGLVTVMKSNKIDCFDINDGQIMYKKKEIKQPITKTHLMNVLSTFYNGDSERVNELNTFIMENRKIVTKETISRKVKDADAAAAADIRPQFVS